MRESLFEETVTIENSPQGLDVTREIEADGTPIVTVTNAEFRTEYWGGLFLYIGTADEARAIKEALEWLLEQF